MTKKAPDLGYLFDHDLNQFARVGLKDFIEEHGLAWVIEKRQMLIGSLGYAGAFNGWGDDEIEAATEVLNAEIDAIVSSRSSSKPRSAR